jgi:hypothetical protein
VVHTGFVGTMPQYMIMLRSGSLSATESARLSTLCGSVKELTDNVQVVDCAKTAQEISETVFPRDSEGKAEHSHVVFRIGDSWWGFFDKTLWEWLNTHARSSNA